MKRLISTVFVLVWAATAFAQSSALLKQTLTLAEVEINDGALTMSVFNMPEEGQNHYYLSLGTLGFGDDFIQLHLDPFSQLFIPLGDNLADAQALMEEFKALAKEDSGTELETVGTLSIGNPATGEQEPVYVNSRRFLGQKILEFSIRRDGYVRATHISRADFGSLLNSLKFYRKLHPKEK